MPATSSASPAFCINSLSPPIGSPTHSDNLRSGFVPEPAACFDKRGDRIHPLSRLQVCEYERPVAAHELGVAFHHGKRCADVRSKVDLVDHQEVGAGDARSAFARD